MSLPGKAALLRIFVGEADRADGRPLHEAIVLKARERHLAGATVLKGVMGFGANSRVHSAGVLRLSEDLPLIIEIVDERAKIDAFLTHLDGMIREGLATIEEVEVVWYRSSKGR